MVTNLVRTGLLLAAFGLGQSQTISFEVASVRPSPPPGATFRTPVEADPGRVMYSALSPKILIQIAYKAAAWKIRGGPAWLESDRYDIAATLPAGSSTDQIPSMVEALLAERFHLTLHREMKEMPVLALVVGKDGPKLKPADTGEQWDHGAFKGGMFRGEIQLHRLSMPGLAEALTGRTDKPVVDMTNLPGLFDVGLTWTPEDTPPDDPKAGGPSIYTALQEQLGLRLQPRTAPVELLVVDRIERPTEN